MKPPRFPCSICRRGTTKANVELDGRCKSCREIWTRSTYAAALDRIPKAAEKVVENAIRIKPTLALAVTETKKTLGSIRESAGREWDVALLVMVDERRKARR